MLNSNSACVVYSETLLTSLLENLHFDFEIEPIMCKLWVNKAASTELMAWIEKSLIYSFDPLLPRNSTREKFASAFRNQSAIGILSAHAREILKLCIYYVELNLKVLLMHEYLVKFKKRSLAKTKLNDLWLKVLARDRFLNFTRCFILAAAPLSFHAWIVLFTVPGAILD